MKYIKRFLLLITLCLSFVGIRDCLEIKKTKEDIIAYSKEVSESFQKGNNPVSELKEGYYLEIVTSISTYLVYKLSKNEPLCFNRSYSEVIKGVVYYN